MKVFLGEKPWRGVAPLLIRRWRSSAIRKLSLELIEAGTSVVLSILCVAFYLINLFLLTLNNPAKLLRHKNEIEMRKIRTRLEDVLSMVTLTE